MSKLERLLSVTCICIVIYRMSAPDATASHFGQPRTRYREPNYAPPQNPPPQIVAEILQAVSQGDLYKVTHYGSIYDLNFGDNDNRCPLHLAAADGQALIVKFLISKGVNVNCEDRFGNTPLHEALRGNHTEIAYILQAAGAHMSQCPALIHILTSCLSSDPAVRVPAETTLQASLAQAHGCTVQLLHVITATTTVPPHVRVLAATCFKNCIAKRWKKVQIYTITHDEKAQARVLCTSCLLLPEPAIFSIVMAAAAKMLRTDWTTGEWPDLLPNVISLASSPDPVSARRGMQALHLLVRELSSMPLNSEKQKFILACPHIAAITAPAWQQQLPHVLSSAEVAEAARTVAKVHKYTLVRSAALAVPGGPVFAFLESCFHICSFTSDLCSSRAQCTFPEQITALTRTIFSCFRAFIKSLPVQCSPILPNLAGASVQLLVSCSHAHAIKDTAAYLACRATAVLDAILFENLYRANSTRVTCDPAAKQQAVAAFDSFFTGATVGQLVDLLASSYCSLSPAQLARWEESPEAFSNECDAQV